MPDAVLSSPLAGATLRQLQADGKACSLTELPFEAMFNLRGKADDAGFAAAVLQHTGMHLPVKPNTASIDPGRQLLWLGPDEWLLKLRDGQGGTVVSALRAALQGMHAAVIEVGDGSTTLALKGPAAADLLARGCPLDLHGRAFPDGSLAQSHVAKASVTVLCLHAGTDYELTVRRSFARYLFEWLTAAGS